MHDTALAMLVGNVFSLLSTVGLQSLSSLQHMSTLTRNTRTLFLPKTLPSGSFLTTCTHLLFQLCQPSSKAGASAAPLLLTLSLTTLGIIQNSCQHPHAPQKQNLTCVPKTRTEEQRSNIATQGSSGFAYLKDAK